MTEKELLEAWDKEICKKGKQIDPSQELCWRSLFIGFAIAKGYQLKYSGIYNIINKLNELYKEAFKYEGGS